MIYIAHRGNTDGPHPHHENTPAYIDNAIQKGFDVEIDVWGYKVSLWLGHDEPQRKIESIFLYERYNHLWIHCKNADALRQVRDHVPGACYFFHQKDDYTVVSNGVVWCYPGKFAPPGSIVLLPEVWMNLTAAPEYLKERQALGVCSDFVSELKA